MKTDKKVYTDTKVCTDREHIAWVLARTLECLESQIYEDDRSIEEAAKLHKWKLGQAASTRRRAYLSLERWVIGELTSHDQTIKPTKPEDVIHALRKVSAGEEE